MGAGLLLELKRLPCVSSHHHGSSTYPVCESRGESVMSSCFDDGVVRVP